MNTDALVANTNADELADVVSLHQPNWSSSTTAIESFEHYAARYFSSGASASKPLVFTEPVPEYRNSSNTDAMMRLMWGTLVAGAGFLVPNDTRWKWEAGVPLNPIFDRVGYASTFFNGLGVDFHRMVPNEEVATMFADGFDVSAPCLSLPGKQYVIYSSRATSVSLDLGDAPGTFSVRFFSPRVGAFDTNEFTISGGAIRTVSTPSIDDWAVWVVKK